ncbi:hypothetical protein BH23GEM6_BH23GEM6_18020 [soil metagenome]
MRGAPGSLIRFETVQGMLTRCLGCSSFVSTVHRQRRRRVRDLNLAHATVDLLIPHRILRWQ